MLPYPNALWQRTIFIAAFAAGISNSIAVAQDNQMSSWQAGPEQVTSPEVVIISPPPRGPTRSTIGAPIQDVSLSASVRTDDLNLQSPADMLELRNRVRETARQLCARLRFQHPIGWPDEFRCRLRATENAFDQINAAIMNYPAAPGMENP